MRSDRAILEFRRIILQLSQLYCYTNYNLTMFFWKVEGLDNNSHHFSFPLKMQEKLNPRMHKNGVSTKTESTFERIKFQNLKGKRPESGKSKMKTEMKTSRCFYAGTVSLAFIHTAIQPNPDILRTGKIQIISHTKCKIFFLPTNFWTCMCACTHTCARTHAHKCMWMSISLRVSTCMS